MRRQNGCAKRRAMLPRESPNRERRTENPLFLIRPNEPRLLDYVILDRGEALLTIRARLEIDVPVECVDPEVIMMRTVPLRRHRPEVARLPRAIYTFLERLAAALREAGRRCGNAINHPV